MKKYIKIIIYFKLILIVFIININASSIVQVENIKENSKDIINNLYENSSYISNDILIMPRPIENLLSIPNFYETSEYLIGSVSVGVILLESNGLIDDNLEDWTTFEKDIVTLEIHDSMNWWEKQNPAANVTFHFDWNYDVPVSYEPIIHPSAVTDDYYQQLWVSEALTNIGYDTGDWVEKVYSYINDLRNEMVTNWGYVIFIVDSSEDLDGAFSDGYFAYSYLGGPLLIMTYDNQRFGIEMMNHVLAHEMGHSFWATDEYDGRSQYSGYLNALDMDGSGCIMDSVDLCLSSGTSQQLGWRDTDSDSILDIVDTNPITYFELLENNSLEGFRFGFIGTSNIQPYPNNNPYRSENDISINTIENIQYRINEGDWIDIPPLDGQYDNDIENFKFITGPLPKGIYKIEVKAINSVGNSDLNPAFLKLTVNTNNSEPLKPIKPQGPTFGKTNKNYKYSSSTTDPDGEDVFYLFDWGNGENSGWIGPLYSGEEVVASNIWLTNDNYVIRVKAKDINGFESDWSDPLSITMPKNKAISTTLFLQRLIQRFPLLEKILNQIK